jgi:hypothetical protein
VEKTSLNIGVMAVDGPSGRAGGNGAFLAERSQQKEPPMVSTYTAQSEPEEKPVVMHFCANCGQKMLRPKDSLPDICPGCNDLTTWLEHMPRHIRRSANASSRKAG